MQLREVWSHDLQVCSFGPGGVIIETSDNINVSLNFRFVVKEITVCVNWSNCTAIVPIECLPLVVVGVVEVDVMIQLLVVHGGVVALLAAVGILIEAVRVVFAVKASSPVVPVFLVVLVELVFPAIPGKLVLLEGVGVVAVEVDCVSITVALTPVVGVKVIYWVGEVAVKIAALCVATVALVAFSEFFPFEITNTRVGRSGSVSQPGCGSCPGEVPWLLAAVYTLVIKAHVLNLVPLKNARCVVFNVRPLTNII